MPTILPRFTYVKRSGDALTPLGSFVCLFLMAIDLFYAYALSSQLRVTQEPMFSMPAHIISLTALVGFILAGYISLPLRGLLTCTLVGSAIPVLICGIVLTAGAAPVSSCSYGLATFVGIALGIRIPGIFVYMLDVSRNRLGNRSGLLISGYLFSFCLCLVQQAFLYQAVGMTALNGATSSTSSSDLTALYTTTITKHISYLTLSYGIVLSLGSLIFVISAVPHKVDPMSGDYRPQSKCQKISSFRAVSSEVAAPVVSPFHITGVKVGDQYIANSSSHLSATTPRTAYSSTIKTPLDIAQAESNPHAVLSSTTNGSVMFAVHSVNTMKNMTFAAYETSFNNSGNDIRHNGVKTLRLFNKGVHNRLAYQICALVCLLASLEILFATLAYIQYNLSSVGHLQTIFLRLVPDLTKIGSFTDTSGTSNATKRLYLQNLFGLAIWCGVSCFLLFIFSILAAFVSPLFIGYRQRLLEIPGTKKLIYTLVTPAVFSFLLLYLPNLLIAFFCGTTDCPGYDNPFTVYFVIVISVLGGSCVLFLVSLIIAHIYEFTEQLNRKFSRPIIRLMAIPLIVNPLLTRLLVFDLSRVSYFSVVYSELNNESTTHALVLVGILICISGLFTALGLILIVVGKGYEHTAHVDFEKIGITFQSSHVPRKSTGNLQKKALKEDEVLHEIPKPFSRVLVESSSHSQSHDEAQSTGDQSHYPDKTYPNKPAADRDNLGRSIYQVEAVCDSSTPMSPAGISPSTTGQPHRPRDSLTDP